MENNYEEFWNMYKIKNIELSQELKDLISRLIFVKSEERLSIDEILKHKWIKQNVKEELIVKDEEEVFNIKDIFSFYGEEHQDFINEFKLRKRFLRE